MATNKSTDKVNDKPGITTPISDAFPEPRAWALNWDSAALQASSSRPKPTNPKFVRS